MLSQEEKKEIDKEIAAVPYKKSACIEAMKIIQRHRGWLNDDSLVELAEYFDMTAHELDSIASFYNLLYRHPVGKHVILVCDSISCWVMGYQSIMEYLQQALGIPPGGTTDDGLFTLLTVPCLGLCDEAPAMIIDTTNHTCLTLEKIDKIIDELRKAN